MFDCLCSVSLFILNAINNAIPQSSRCGCTYFIMLAMIIIKESVTPIGIITFIIFNFNIRLLKPSQYMYRYRHVAWINNVFFLYLVRSVTKWNGISFLSYQRLQLRQKQNCQARTIGPLFQVWSLIADSH